MAFKTYNQILDAEVAAGAPVDANLLGKIKDNFDNLKPRDTFIVLDSTIDWSLANVYKKTLTGVDPATTNMSIINIEEGSSKSVVVNNTDSVLKNIVFAGVLWAESDPVTQIPAGTTTVFTFVSSDGIVYATAVESLG